MTARNPTNPTCHTRSSRCGEIRPCVASKDEQNRHKEAAFGIINTEAISTS